MVTEEFTFRFYLPMPTDDVKWHSRAAARE